VRKSKDGMRSALLKKWFARDGLLMGVTPSGHFLNRNSQNNSLASPDCINSNRITLVSYADLLMYISKQQAFLGGAGAACFRIMK
jgi:hypothetical protein